MVNQLIYVVSILNRLIIKRDSWKKLEGISILEAMHTYVEALLRITTEVMLQAQAINFFFFFC